MKSGICQAGIAVCLLVVGAAFPGRAAEKNTPAEPKAKPGAEETIDAQQALRSYLQLQEQLHNALLTIEQSRQEADAEAKRNAEAIAERLKSLELALDFQRERQERNLEAMRGTNHFMQVFTVIFAVLGLLGIWLASWFQVRAMNRLAEIATALAPGPELGPGRRAAAALAGGQTPLVALNPSEQASGRLLGAIERLEKRVHELESSTHPSLPAQNQRQDDAPRSILTASATDSGHDEKAERISLMLGKGLALLNLEQLPDAVACFDEVIALDPRNAEALVKKGAALERLKKPEEAIECYDRAIAADHSMTLAWLYKGGVFNQLERFSEALQCYEQALRTQQKTPLA